MTDPKPKRPSKSAHKKRDWLRKYGSKERVEFVTELPCATCDRKPDEVKNQNSHISSGGTGFKSGYLNIIPQCFTCHNEMGNGILTFLRAKDLYPEDLYEMAREIEIAWQNHRERSRNE